MHWKRSFLVTQKTLRLFVNTLTVDEKHYLLTRDNLTQTIQIELSQKQKHFFVFFFAFLKSILNFKHLPKKYDPHSWCNSGNTASLNYGYINVWKAVFQRTLRQTTWQMGQNTVPIWIAAPLQYLLVTVKVVAFEKVSFNDTQSPKCIS